MMKPVFISVALFSSLANTVHALPSFVLGDDAKGIYRSELDSDEDVELALDTKAIDARVKEAKAHHRTRISRGNLYTEIVLSKTKENSTWKCGRVETLVVGLNNVIETSYESRIVKTLSRFPLATRFIVGAVVAEDYVCHRK
jgi:hypothetical protein